MGAPSQIVPTMKVHSDDTAEGYVIINESDFDPSVHQIPGEPLDLTDEERAQLPALGTANPDEPNVFGEGNAPEGTTEAEVPTGEGNAPPEQPQQ